MQNKQIRGNQAPGGHKQGCCLSPILFSLYIQEISSDLARSGEGIWVGPEGDKVCIPALLFADDLVLLAEGEQPLQRLLNILGHGAAKLNMTLSPGKSKVLTSWRGPDKKRKWKCGSMHFGEGIRAKVYVDIEEEGEYKYLGVWVKLYGKMFAKHADTLVMKARKHMGMNRRLWEESGKSIWVAEKLWVAATMPALLYGSEVLVLQNSDITRVDVVQRHVARVMLGGHKGCAIKALYGELGWRDVRYDMDRRLLRYVGRMWSGIVSEDRWASKVFREGLEDVILGNTVTPWWGRVDNALKEYDIDVGVLLRKEGIHSWRKHVDKQIDLKEVEMWEKGMGEMYTMRYYREKAGPCHEAYLAENWEYKREIFRVRTGQAMLNYIRARWDKKTQGEKCVLCKGATETEEHLVLECTKLGDLRDKTLGIFEGELGREAGSKFRGLEKRDKMVWLLGLNASIRKVLSKVTWRKVLGGIGRMLYIRDRAAEKITKVQKQNKGINK